MDKSKFKNRQEWRKFGISVGIIFSVLATLQVIVGKDLWPFFFAASALFFTLALVVPIVLKPIYVAFTYLGLVMGWIMTRVILTILFFGVITPVSLMTKIFNKHFLELRILPSAKSYWMDKRTSSIKDYENQF